MIFKFRIEIFWISALNFLKLKSKFCCIYSSNIMLALKSA